MLTQKEGKRLAQTVAILRREERQPGVAPLDVNVRVQLRAEVAREAILAFLLDAKIYAEDAGAAEGWELDRGNPVAPSPKPPLQAV